MIASIKKRTSIFIYGQKMARLMALSTCPERSLRSQWDNGQARHSLNLSLPFVVAYCLTEISAFSQAMWTNTNLTLFRIIFTDIHDACGILFLVDWHSLRLSFFICCPNSRARRRRSSFFIVTFLTTGGVVVALSSASWIRCPWSTPGSTDGTCWCRISGSDRVGWSRNGIA